MSNNSIITAVGGPLDVTAKIIATGPRGQDGDVTREEFAAHLADYASRFPDNAGARNCLYRGKFLGNAVTSQQYTDIANGTFADMYIGDYWTIGSITYRIAAFDYYINTGDVSCTAHHAVLVPDYPLYDAQMNPENTTAGGYVGSAMYTANLEQAKTTIKTAFSGHVLNHRMLFTNAVTFQSTPPIRGATRCGSVLES